MPVFIGIQPDGAVAQLGARKTGSLEVTGSTPVSSTILSYHFANISAHQKMIPLSRKRYSVIFDRMLLIPKLRSV